MWLATFYRLVSSKTVRHRVSCAACRAAVSGLRYQCLRCIGYDLCQGCFFYGRTSRSHKPTHPIQEYCTRSTKRDATKALIKLLANNLKRRSRATAVRYLPHQPTAAVAEDASSRWRRQEHRHSPAAASAASSAEAEMESYQLQGQPQQVAAPQEPVPQTVTVHPPVEGAVALTPALIR